jgi:predicted house-cleaning NTP pyrophosphatase (Maf/HAM1 superfamily)
MERLPKAEAVAHINKPSQFELGCDRILRIDGNRFGRPKKLEA